MGLPALEDWLLAVRDPSSGSMCIHRDLGPDRYVVLDTVGILKTTTQNQSSVEGGPSDCVKKGSDHARVNAEGAL